MHHQPRTGFTPLPSSQFHKSVIFPCSYRTKRFRGAQDERQPGAKKPPNAFMLYAKEERAKVAAELGSSHAALVNKALSQKVGVFDIDLVIFYFFFFAHNFKSMCVC